VKDALRRRDENISSFEVERVINDHPSVLERAVVGVPAERAEFDPAELTRFLIPRLPYFMVPKYLEVVPEMPRTPNPEGAQERAARLGDRRRLGPRGRRHRGESQQLTAPCRR
jgi:crotonobetaine/carnitine-CoA ligase